MTTKTLNPWGVGRRSRLNGRWSLNHDRCRRCKQTDKPHHGHGLCHSCHQIEWKKLEDGKDLRREKKVKNTA